MADRRRIERSVRGIKTSDGAGVSLTRIIGSPLLPRLDPFLMLDEFGSDEPRDYLAGFPDHPHRGFETITYMIAGKFRHRDNHGGEGLLSAGGAQWMTAGRGIVHSEMPEQTEGRVAGFQLWLNLPAKDKMCAPSYRDLHEEDIPTALSATGATLRVLAGVVGDVTGPISGRDTAPVYIEARLALGQDAEIPLSPDLDGFVYPFEGEVRIEGRVLGRGELGVLTRGGAVVLEAATQTVRAIVVAGRPIGEPIAQHGPFVMNTRAELEEAIRDYQAGRF